FFCVPLSLCTFLSPPPISTFFPYTTLFRSNISMNFLLCRLFFIVPIHYNANCLCYSSVIAHLYVSISNEHYALSLINSCFSQNKTPCRPYSRVLFSSFSTRMPCRFPHFSLQICKVSA